MQHQVKQSINKCDKILGHLKYLDDLADKKNDVVNEHLPTIVTVVDSVKTTLEMLYQEI